MMHKRILIGLLAAATLCLSGCRSSDKNLATSKTSSKNKQTSAKSGQTTFKQQDLSKPTETTVSSSAHAANCKKLGVSASNKDNFKLYKECASWIGTPYKYGGTSKSGTDCSGMTYSIYKAVYGKTLTRQSGDILANNCSKINKNQLREGDLVFFRTDGKRSSTPNHVGIYLKENKFIHSSSSKGVVVSDLTQDYYVKNWISGGRVK